LARTADVAQTTQRFDEVLNRATTTLVVTIADTPAEAPTTARIETTLANQEQQIQSLLLTAPEPARSDLRGALVTAERSRALVADQQSSDRALDRGGSGGKPSLAAPEPPMAVESEPTVVPEPTATPLPQLAQQQPAPADRVADKHDVAAPSARDTANARESRAASPHNRPNTDQTANDV